MKRIVVILVVVLLALLVLVFIFNPRFLADIWLYIVGLIGTIIAGFQSLVEWFKKQFKEDENTPQLTMTGAAGGAIVTNQAGTATTTTPNSQPNPLAIANLKQENQALQAQVKALQAEANALKKEIDRPTELDAFVGTTISVVRFMNNSRFSLGLMYYNDAFFCYTLEDVYRAQKVKKHTRIWAGEYKVSYSDVNPEHSSITKRYRTKDSTKDFFDRHIEIHGVDQFDGIYIHIGNNERHTEGCLLVGDGLNTSGGDVVLTHSTGAFTRFYKKVTAELNAGTPVRIKILDEDWMQYNHLNIPTNG